VTTNPVFKVAMLFDVK